MQGEGLGLPSAWRLFQASAWVRHGREAATQALETGLTTAFNRIEVDHHRPGALAAADGVFGVFLGPRRKPIGVLLEVLAGVIAGPGSVLRGRDPPPAELRNDGPTARPDRDGSDADDRCGWCGSRCCRGSPWRVAER